MPTADCIFVQLANCSVLVIRAACRGKYKGGIFEYLLVEANTFLINIRVLVGFSLQFEAAVIRIPHKCNQQGIESMTNSGSNKSHIKRSKTSLQRKKKSERIGSDATEQIKPDDQDNKQEEMYKTLIENIPCAVYSAFPGERGPTTFMSQNWKDWTGYSAEELYQDPKAWPKCIYPDDRQKAVNAYVEACKNEASYNLEYRIVHRDTGQVRYVRDQGLLSKDAKGTLVRVDGNITDITEVKTSENELVKYRDQLEELVKERTDELEKANEVLKLQDKKRKKVAKALRENEEKYYSLIANIPDVVWTTDQNGQTTFISSNIEKIYGYTPEDISEDGERLWFGRIHPDDVERVKKAFKAVFEEGVQLDVEYRIRRKDGEWIWLHDRSIGAYEKNGIKYADGVFFDITERKKAEEKLLDYQAQLKSLASQLSLVEEHERRRMAMVLHDQIGQSLVFSKIKLDELHHSATSTELTKALDEICINIGQIIQDTRTLTFDLSSPILNELGFEAAVTNWLDEQIQEKHGIKTEFEDDGQPKPLDEDIQALLFRNVRELLINVVKHANAQNVKVSVRKVDDLINISVEDNGKGFDPNEIASKATFGLFSIRERLVQLDGSFEIKSEPGHGSKFTITAPLKRV